MKRIIAVVALVLVAAVGCAEGNPSGETQEIEFETIVLDDGTRCVWATTNGTQPYKGFGYAGLSCDWEG